MAVGSSSSFFEALLLLHSVALKAINPFYPKEIIKCARIRNTARSYSSSLEGMPSAFGFVAAITSLIPRIMDTTWAADFKACCLTQTGSITSLSSLFIC
jgi:hypothetical protein